MCGRGIKREGELDLAAVERRYHSLRQGLLRRRLGGEQASASLSNHDISELVVSLGRGYIVSSE